MEANQCEGHCPFGLNSSLVEQQCPKGVEQRKELWVSFLPSQPHRPASWTSWEMWAVPRECSQWLFPWGQQSASGAQAWEMQEDVGFHIVLQSERCHIATMSH